jgi:4-aminobutyrate aminotransferase-like enzyme
MGCCSPLGFAGGTVKIAPPLVINEAAILEGVSVLEEVLAKTVNKRKAVA